MTENNYYINKKYKMIFWNNALVTPLGRIAFVNIHKPSTTYEKPKYGVTLLIDKKDEEQIKKLKEMKEELVKIPPALLGANWQEEIKRAKHPMFRNGDEKEYDGFSGHYYIVANNSEGPGHSKGFKLKNDDMTADMYEAGMICRLVVNAGFSAEQGFFYTLKAIKMIKDDGVRFNGAPKVDHLLDGLDDAVSSVTSAPGFGDL